MGTQDDRGEEMKIVKLLVWMGLIVLIPMAASQAAVNDFAGLWQNIDTDTRGITQLSIAVTGTKAKIHTWAACHPKACDWGTVTARLAPNNMLKAYYKNNFSERILVLAKTGNHLKVDMLTRYTGNSGRPDKKAVYQFKRMPTFSGQHAEPNAKPNASAQPRPNKGAVSAGNLNAESGFRPGVLKILYPKGGEELVAGSNIAIKWKSSKVKKSVSLILMVENRVAKRNVPIIITKNAPNTGSYRYRLPFKWNSRLGYRYQIVVQEGDLKANSPQFTVYPRIDIVVQNPRVRSKKKGGSWFTWATTMATGILQPALIKSKSNIEIKFDLKNTGIEIIKSKFMSKVAVRLNPGNAELNSAGFSHQNIVPGRTYHYKAKINPKDWDMTAGNYRLEIWADPQNNTHEHEQLRENNRIIIPFRIK
jgi:hypothetical protein